MNINQAKRVAGIGYSVSGETALSSALNDCKAQIVEARKRGDDRRAAELSEAREVFKRRSRRNRCEICEAPISRSATRCAMHQRAKAFLPGPAARPKPKKRQGRKRIPIAPVGGVVAQLGFYTPDVQAVVTKWRDKIPQERIEQYFCAVAFVIIHPALDEGLNLPRIIPPGDWPAIFELGTAISRVWADTSRAATWLLRLPGSVAENGEFPSWGDLRTQIKQSGGPLFTIAELKSAARRMLILTPEPIAKEWLATNPFRVKNGA